MNARDAYLEDLLSAPPRERLEHLFRLRAKLRSAESRAETPKEETTRRPFLTQEQVADALRAVEAKLFTAPEAENATELEALAGRTDIHSRWWRRLVVANESRPALERLARQSPHWRLIVSRICEVVATPQSRRDEARNRFWSEVEPIFAAPGSRRVNLYELTQQYGDRTAFQTLMSRLALDAPAFHGLEPIFFAKFNPSALAGHSLLDPAGPPRASYCPLELPAAEPGSARLKAQLVASYVLGALFWAYLLFRT